MARRLAVFADTPLLLARLRGEDIATGLEIGAVRTGIMNLFEMVHQILRRGQERAAHQAFESLAPVAFGLDRDVLFEASRLRVRAPERGLSYADAAGYATARANNLLFVTTDRGFQGLPGVRIVSLG